MTNNVVCDDVTKDPVCKMIETTSGIPAMEAMHNLQLELLHVIDRSNLSITNLSFSTKCGTLCFDMPSKGRWRGNTGGPGSIGGPVSS